MLTTIELMLSLWELLSSLAPFISVGVLPGLIWQFPKIWGTFILGYLYFGVLIVRVLLLGYYIRVPYFRKHMPHAFLQLPKKGTESYALLADPKMHHALREPV